MTIDLIFALGTNWLLSRPFDLILSLCTQLHPFKTIWPDFCIVYSIDSFQDHLTWFCIVYPVDYFQDHMTWFLHCVPNWPPFKTIWPNFHCTQLTPFKTTWLDFIIVYPNLLLSRPYDMIFVLCTQLTPFKTIWLDFCIVFFIVPNNKIRSNGLERSQLGTQCKYQVIWSWKESNGYTMIKIHQMVLKGVIWVHNDKIVEMVLKGFN